MMETFGSLTCYIKTKHFSNRNFSDVLTNNALGSPAKEPNIQLYYIQKEAQ